MTNALGLITDITSVNGMGQPLSITDPNGVVTTFTYDKRSQVMLTDPTGEIVFVPLFVGVGGQIILRVAVTYGGKNVIRWLTARFLARIAPLWALNNITWTVVDVAEFGAVVVDPNSTKKDIFKKGLETVYDFLDPIKPIRGLRKVLKSHKAAPGRVDLGTKLVKTKPHPGAEGPHTTWKTDPQTGKITRHETWTLNPRNPSGFDTVQSTDITGRPHVNKRTGEAITTPHTQGKHIPGGVRPATPNEIPR